VTSPRAVDRGTVDRDTAVLGAAALGRSAGDPAEVWWREAVIYQVYPRSFADSDGDGVGDLPGITARLGHLAALGVDALWLCPFYPSGGVDGGYDIVDHTAVDPVLGSLADLETLVLAAHGHGLRVLVDLVPNHVSDAHPWFRAAIAGGPDAPERALFHMREGRGPGGDEPPSNWRSVFGGPSWTRILEPDGTPGPWYYHLFAAEQPDLDWEQPAVRAELERIVRFWLDRGIDGFRIDVSDALIKDPAFPDTPDGSPVIPKDESSPVHEIYRGLRRVLDEYPGDRAAVVETGAPDDVVALFVRPDEMHLAFGFRFLHAGWSAPRLREAIGTTLAANALVGAPSTWVTDNHDTPRSVTRYAREGALAGAYLPGALDGAAPVDEDELERGRGRARAMAVLLLALPGTAFLYAGQELGLPEVTELPDEALRDPAFVRSGGAVRGRDGCRVPLPWSGQRPPFGFSPGGESWLPQPEGWASLSVEVQEADEGSMLRLYRRMLGLRRREPSLRGGSVRSLDDDGSVLRLERSSPEGGRLLLVVNLGDVAVPLPAGEVLLRSDMSASSEAVGGLAPLLNQPVDHARDVINRSVEHGAEGRPTGEPTMLLPADSAAVIRLDRRP